MPPAAKLARHEKRELTRARLIDATLRLIAIRGLDRCSLDDICAEAGLTRGAFHYNFASREELLAAALASELKARSTEAAVQFTEARNEQEWQDARASTLDYDDERLNRVRYEARLKLELALAASRHPELQAEVGELFAIARQRAANDLARLLDVADLELHIPPDAGPRILRAFEDGALLQHLADPANNPIEFAFEGGDVLVKALLAHYTSPRKRAQTRPR